MFIYMFIHFPAMPRPVRITASSCLRSFTMDSPVIYINDSTHLHGV